ncbi:MAG TPA: helix-turn-helix domain-containing protein [Gaiellaceae bacterium]|nr:helix-turn-helix domain-containing protein [Gaiellaceae bacterium]
MDVVIRDLGRRLREFRHARRRTLEEVAEDTGLTPGYLSQIETGEAVPSLSALAAIAAAMGTDMTAFFPFNDDPGVRITRAGDPDRLRISPTSREQYDVLSARGPSAAMTALISRYERGDSVGPYSQFGERFALVLDGRVRFNVDGEDRVAGPGEFVHFSSHPEQSTDVVSDGPAEILWLVTPPIV